MHEMRFQLDGIQPPFRLDLTAWALRRNPVNEIDSWDGEAYSRVLVLDRRPTLVRVTQSGGIRRPILHVRALSSEKIKNLKPRLAPVLRRILGLDVDLKEFYRLARGDEKLGALSGRFLGLKPPRFPSVFEGVVNGIACQQLSLHVGLILLNRLAAKCGLAIQGWPMSSFPTPENLEDLSVQDFRKCGFSENKAKAIKNLARVYGRSFPPGSLEEMGDAEAIAEFKKLKGVGRWTAEYALLRGMGRIRIFPGDDVGGQSKLKRWLKLKRDLDYEGVNEVLARWKPFAGLIYFHLLLDGLERKGVLAGKTYSQGPS